MNPKAVLVLALLSLAVLIGWYAGASGTLVGAKPVQPPANRSAVASVDESSGTKSHSPDTQLRGQEDGPRLRLEKMPLSHLLAEFELTGDLRFLEAARLKHGKDPRFLMVAALSSESPDSKDLATLEAAQPDNALPNVLRAGMYARTNNWTKFKEELAQAISKQSLTSSDLERKAAVLDILIADPSRVNHEAVKSKLDEKFFSQVKSIERALQRNTALYGGSAETASIGIGLAMKLRHMGENDFSAGLLSDDIELGLLKRVTQTDPDSLYGDSGLTVRQRIAQINADAVNKKKLSALLASVFQPATDATTRMRFVARVRADGEMSALSWLEKKRALP